MMALLFVAFTIAIYRYKAIQSRHLELYYVY